MAASETTVNLGREVPVREVINRLAAEWPEGPPQDAIADAVATMRDLSERCRSLDVRLQVCHSLHESAIELVATLRSRLRDMEKDRDEWKTRADAAVDLGLEAGRLGAEAQNRAIKAEADLALARKERDGFARQAEAAWAERDAARVERDDARKERDEARRLNEEAHRAYAKATRECCDAEAERDEARKERDEAREEVKAVSAQYRGAIAIRAEESRNPLSCPAGGGHVLGQPFDGECPACDAVVAKVAEFANYRPNVIRDVVSALASHHPEPVECSGDSHGLRCGGWACGVKADDSRDRGGSLKAERPSSRRTLSIPAASIQGAKDAATPPADPKRIPLSEAKPGQRVRFECGCDGIVTPHKDVGALGFRTCRAGRPCDLLSHTLSALVSLVEPEAEPPAEPLDLEILRRVATVAEVQDCVLIPPEGDERLRKCIALAGAGFLVRTMDVGIYARFVVTEAGKARLREEEGRGKDGPWACSPCRAGRHLGCLGVDGVNTLAECACRNAHRLAAEPPAPPACKCDPDPCEGCGRASTCAICQPPAPPVSDPSICRECKSVVGTGAVDDQCQHGGDGTGPDCDRACARATPCPACERAVEERAEVIYTTWAATEHARFKSVTWPQWFIMSAEVRGPWLSASRASFSAAAHQGVA